MDPEDAINLLMRQARAERSEENLALAEAIVQVLTFTFFLNRVFHTKYTL